MSTITLIIFQIILAIIIHESGHFLAALLCGKVLHFKLVVNRLFFIPIPSGVWYMPEGLSLSQRKFIAQSGFSLEILAIPFLPFIYGLIVALHFIAYPWYAGSSTDFKFMY